MTAVGNGYYTKELARQLKYIYSERLNAWKIEVWVKIHEPVKKQCSSKNSWVSDRESQLDFSCVNVRYDVRVHALTYLFTTVRAHKFT